MEIDIAVRDKIARLGDKNIFLVCGNSDYVVNFHCDEEWDEYTTKTARFKYNGFVTDIVFQGESCQVPVIQNAPFIEVGLFAGDLHTTTPARIFAKRSILCGEGVPAEPSEDVYNQIMELLNSFNMSTTRMVTVALPENAWTGADNVYWQIVEVEGVTANSKIDLQPSPDQLQDLIDNEISLTTVNEAGTIYVYSIGGTPDSDFVMQATVTEVPST